MRILAMIAGLDDFALLALIDPHETIATLYDMLEKQLIFFKMPPVFIAGYSVHHTCQGGFDDDDDPDFIGMANGDADVMAKYLTPAARLDPQKTLADYFGTNVPDETISIVLTWPPESIAEEKRKRERGEIAFDEWLAKQKQKQDASFRTTQAPSRPAKKTIARDSQAIPPSAARTIVPDPWQWLAPCFPPALAARCASHAVRRYDGTNKEKNE